MQFLLNKGKFNFGQYPKSEAYDPFHQVFNWIIKFVQDIESRRSKLFPDRKRIPGRKTKFIFAIIFLVQAFATYRLIQAKKIYGYFFIIIKDLKEPNNKNYKEKSLHISNRLLILNTQS